MRLRILAFFALFLILGPGFLPAEVKSSERLALLKQATGSSSTSSSPASFQSRLDAIMNTTAEPERMSVENQDARNAEMELMKVGPEEDAFETSTAEDLRIENTEMPSRKKENEEENPRMDASEKKHREGMEKVYEELDARRAEELKRSQEEAARLAAPPETTPSGDAALNNNPFYFKPKDGPIKRTFEDNKPIIKNRLMQLLGFPEDEAEQRVREASSPEELVIVLMREYEFTYSEANQVIQIPETGDEAPEIV